MNWKKIIIYGVLLWVFIFVIITILMFVPALAGNESLQNILSLIGIAILIFILSLFYFKKNPANFGKGLLVGLIWVVTGSILDLIITIPLFTQPSGVGYAEFYSQPSMWVGFGISILLTGIFAAIISKCCKKDEMKPKVEAPKPDMSEMK